LEHALKDRVPHASLDSMSRYILRLDWVNLSLL